MNDQREPRNHVRAAEDEHRGCGLCLVECPGGVRDVEVIRSVAQVTGVVVGEAVHAVGVVEGIVVASRGEIVSDVTVLVDVHRVNFVGIDVG